MGGCSRLFSYSSVLLLRDHRRVCRPEVREALPRALGWWNALLQAHTRLVAPSTHRVGDHVTRCAAQRSPHPGVVGFFEHKRPAFVQFQRGGIRIHWVGNYQRCR